MPTSPRSPIDINGLLTAEYEYISQTAAEAHEDRARVSSFYLIAVGSLVAALFGTKVFDTGEFNPSSTSLLTVLFALLTFLGTSTIVQLGRLRVAWYQSMLAMNRIKEFAIKYNPELEKAYLWKTKSLPEPDKKKTISYYQVIEVSVISGLMMSAAVFFLVLTFRSTVDVLHWAIAVPLGIAMFFVELALYKWSLK